MDKKILILLGGLVIFVFCSGFTQEEEKIKEKKAQNLYTLGIRYYKQKRYNEALKTFESLSTLYPEYRNSEYYFSRTLEKIIERNKEKARVEKLFSDQKIKNQAYELYARALYALEAKRYKEAKEHLEKILNLDPKHQGAREKLVEVYNLLEKERRKEAYRGLRESTYPEEEYLSLLYKEAKDLLENNRLEEALEKFEEIFELRPDYKDTKEIISKIRLTLVIQEREEKGIPYTLGPDDVLEINVLAHPELSGSVKVQPSGEIILPLVKEVIKAEGLTKDTLEVKLKEVLSKYIKDVQLNVVITGYSSKQWYIIGAVGFHGEYPMGKTRLTLMEALYTAGLPLEATSAMRRVLLIRPHKKDPFYRKIDVAEILYKGRMADNVLIQPGDIIYVPKTVINKFATVIGQIVSPLTATRTSAEDVTATSTAVRAATPIKELVGSTPESKK
ncbi:MAG: polysaccharide biosynthesis/export family protein [Candidatus Omnitrophica bacterium]|nr:polysaccharide biosynthesis/export family protein [Candidatus Omnitrophota bacterium]